MSVIKLVIAAVIILVLFAAFLSGTPNVAGFFDYVKGKAADILSILKPELKKASENVEFSAVLEGSGVVNSVQRNVNIKVSGETNAIIDSANIFTNETVDINGYSGSIVISDALSLDGSFETVSIKDTRLDFPRKSIKLNSNFSALFVQNMELEEFVSNSTGVVSVSGTDISFARIEISNPKGNFTFSKPGLAITGTAKSIVLPESGLRVP